MLGNRASADLSWSSPPAKALAPQTLKEGGGKEPGETLQEWATIIGIVTAIVGNVLIAIALNVQRYAHTRLHKERLRVRQRTRAIERRSKGANQAGQYGTILGDEQDNGPRDGDGPSPLGRNEQPERVSQRDEADPLLTPGSLHSDASNESDDTTGDDKVASTYLKSPYWWLGQILITLGEMGNFLAYGFAPASIVSPLGVVALITNCVIAPVVFHERFRQRDFWGVVVAVGGVVTVVLSARQEETKLNPHDVWYAITTTAFEVYMGITVSLIVILMWASTKYGKRTILIDLGLVGLFGGYTALATKGVSSMLSSTLWRAFTTPVTYALALVLLLTAIMQIRYVNKALQRFSSTQVIPIQFVMFTLSVILGSAILYRDFEKTTAEQAGKFVGGCLLTFFGVFLITSGRQQTADEEEDPLAEDEGVEETIGLRQQDSNTPPCSQEAPVTPVPRSRRSSRLSRVSFAETGRPGSPPRDGVDDLPTLRYTSSAGSGISDAPESAPLLGSPWQETPVVRTSHPRGLRTISADSIPTISRGDAVSRPLLKDLHGAHIYSTQGLTTPPRPPLATLRSGSHQSSHQRSGTFISPSPLSSTVTAMVKDAFLRADDNPQAKRSSLRRIRSTIRASLFFNDEDDDVLPVSSDHPATGNDDGTGVGSDDDPTRLRSHSVSDTLGDYFRPVRKKAKGPHTQSDAEEGFGGGQAGDTSGNRPAENSDS